MVTIPQQLSLLSKQIDDVSQQLDDLSIQKLRDILQGILKTLENVVVIADRTEKDVDQLDAKVSAFRDETKIVQEAILTAEQQILSFLVPAAPGPAVTATAEVTTP